MHLLVKAECTVKLLRACLKLGVKLLRVCEKVDVMLLRVFENWVSSC